MPFDGDDSDAAADAAAASKARCSALALSFLEVPPVTPMAATSFR